MFVRLTFISILADKKADLEKRYVQEIIPVVKKQQGNLGIRLLEPTASDEAYISLTEWETAADAERYESSGTYKELVDSLKPDYSGKPILKTYTAVERKLAVTM